MQFHKHAVSHGRSHRSGKLNTDGFHPGRGGPSNRASFRIPQRIGQRYTRNSYHNAIFKACQHSKIPTWGPNRLRHNAATYLREQFGIEASRVILGHTSAAMTEVYAEIDRSKAAAIMAQVG